MKDIFLKMAIGGTTQHFWSNEHERNQTNTTARR
ncbi:hypothetical protein QE380_000155 [Acinetobacter baylyi]|uniref:Uncharacterized protein n=1 Tax=Acinetobacter baylyi TaxID=202950 RepID=A0ABU0URQ6_ACIBI|nr:hypothetical protein [Acinetobacter baylyi]